MMRFIFAFLLYSMVATPSWAQTGAIAGSISGGSGSGGGAVSSVTGTSGQVTCTPTTGVVVCSLPSTITEALTFSAALVDSATTDATSGSSGAISTLGGIGITKSIFVGGTAS